MDTTRLAWHHLIFQIPPTWEVIGYKTFSGDGALNLSDRFGETMQVFYKIVYVLLLGTGAKLLYDGLTRL